MKNNWIEQLKEENVEVKTLNEISKFSSGDSEITKSLDETGDLGAIVCSDIFESKTYIDECKVFVNREIKNNQTFIEKGDLVIARSGYTKRNQHGSRLFLGDSKVLAGNNTYVLKHNENPKYLISALSSDLFNGQVKCFLKASLSSIMTIDLTNVKKIKIPVPTLDIQERIGNFLFSFVEYEKKLSKELEKRRKQFHFYKEKVFGELLEKCRLRS